MIRKLFINVLCLLFIFAFIKFNVYAYDNKKILNRIPKPVVEYADKRFNYLNNSNVHLVQQKDLNDYKVYRIFFDNCRCGVCGPPRYLIYKNNVVRIASSDEVTEIYFANKKNLLNKLRQNLFMKLYNYIVKTNKK